MNKFQKEDELSPIAIGYMWSMKIISMAIETALIICFGYWLDNQLGTLPVFVLIGSVLALLIFILRLVALTTRSSHNDSDLENMDKE